MNIRVTGQSQTASTIANIQRQSAGQAKYQNQVASGLRVERPSDDPTAFPALARARADGLRFAAFGQTMADATTTLDAGVSALGEVSAVLTQAKQIAIEGADATTDGSGAEALATQVDGLIQRALAATNAQVNGRSLFGGTATTAPPFQTVTDPTGLLTGVTYAGADERGRSLIGPDQTIDTQYVGSEAFQRPGGDLFQTLIGLRDDLRNATLTGPARSAALNARLGQVDATRTAIGEATAEQGSSLVTLEAISARVSDLKLESDIKVGDLGSTDYAEAVVRMQEQQTSLQATLAVSAKLLQPSLLDFIR
jgi:flagellar hook-associated protein 3 FlgL